MCDFSPQLPFHPCHLPTALSSSESSPFLLTSHWLPSNPPLSFLQGIKEPPSSLPHTRDGSPPSLEDVQYLHMQIKTQLSPPPTPWPQWPSAHFPFLSLTQSEHFLNIHEDGRSVGRWVEKWKLGECAFISLLNSRYNRERGIIILNVTEAGPCLTQACVLCAWEEHKFWACLGNRVNSRPPRAT